jgi:hypothetical protein
LEQAKKTVKLLERWEPPPPSEGFEERLRSAILAYEPPPTLWQRWVGFFGRSWRPLVPIAGLVVLVLAVVVARWSGTDGTVSEPGDKDVSLSLGVAPASAPLEMRVADRAAALESMSSTLTALGGRLVRRRSVGDALEVTCTVPAQNEAAFLDALPTLGQDSKLGTAYKDGAGNIVVLLRQAPDGVQR